MTSAPLNNRSRILLAFVSLAFLAAAVPSGSSARTLADSKASRAQLDPYSQFRNASYSNEGLPDEKREIELGAAIHRELRKKYKFTTAGLDRVKRLGAQTVVASRRSNIPYNFYVIISREINAYSTPGGYIYVTNALLRVSNDAELSSVLAHEVGHVVARHTLKTMQNQQAAGGLADLIGSITGVVGDVGEKLGRAAVQIVAGGLIAAHNREEEREADFLGVRNMVRAGFDPEGMVTMFQKLKRLQKSEPDIVQAIFGDHPDVDERIDNTRYEIARMKREGKA